MKDLYELQAEYLESRQKDRLGDAFIPEDVREPESEWICRYRRISRTYLKNTTTVAPV